jgi:hypothetical protein
MGILNIILTLDRYMKLCYNLSESEIRRERLYMTNITSGCAVGIFSRPLNEIIADYIENVITKPVPPEKISAVVPICMDAIDAVNAYDLYKPIALPEGGTATWPDGRVEHTAPAYAIVVRFELQRWLREDWDIEKYEKEKDESKII